MSLCLNISVRPATIFPVNSCVSYISGTSHDWSFPLSYFYFLFSSASFLNYILPSNKRQYWGVHESALLFQTLTHYIEQTQVAWRRFPAMFSRKPICGHK